MRVLIAPDKFKGTLGAAEAAEAIAEGWRRGDPTARLDPVPMADGGEGTLDALLAAAGGFGCRATVTGPLGDPVDAEFGVAVTGGHLVAIVEMARASGLGLVPETRRNPMTATSRGTGELILAACRAGVRRVLVCVGGSATNDGGAGMAQALGYRLLDGHGRELPPGGAALVALAAIDGAGRDALLGDREFVGLVDVDNPLVGADGASAAFGPQKGASSQDVGILDRGLERLAEVAERDLGAGLRDLPGAGAAGGLGGGLVAFLGAVLRPGVDVVMESVGLRDRMARADLAITGEGMFDAGSLRGKVPGGVLRIAGELGVRAVVVCGRAGAEAPGVRVESLGERFGLDAAMARPKQLLVEVAARLAGEEAARVGAGG